MCSLVASSLSTFLQSFITLCCLVFELRDLKEKKKKKKMNKLSTIAPYIYNARHHANPYILSTTVLSDTDIGFEAASRDNVFVL